MATKTKKTSARKASAKMRDLPTKKNPKGGAQKKESNGGTTSAGSPGAGRRPPL